MRIGRRSYYEGAGARMMTAVATVLVLCCSCISTVTASSKPLAPHRRVHVPYDLTYTLVRKSEPEQQRRAPSLGGSFAPYEQQQQHRRDARKRSYLPAPFQLLTADHVTTPRFDDTVLVQLAVPSSSSSEGESESESNEDEIISMLLRPTENLLHPDAKIVYNSYDSLTGLTTKRTEVLHRDSVLAYEGTVVPQEQVEARMAAAKAGLYLSDASDRGWARLLLTPNEEQPGSGKMLAEGAFELDGETHHLKSAKNWLLSRRQYTEEPSMHRKRGAPDDGLILLRDRDLASGAHAIDRRSPASIGGSSGHDTDACSHDSLEFNTDAEHPIHRVGRQQAFDALYSRKEGWLDSLLGVSPADHHQYRRQSTGGDLPGSGNLSSNYLNSIGSTTGCPKSPQVLYMGIAADCTYTANYGDQNATRVQILTNMNTVSALYQRTFNISLGVVELNVADVTCPSGSNSEEPWNVACPASATSGGLDLNDRLSAFSQWRSAKGGGDGAGLWHLLTNCATSREVGVAWLGTLCRVQSSTSSRGEVTSGTGVTSITDREWQVIAHEVGHNFGAIHDCTDGCNLQQSCCPLSRNTCDANADYIMSPVSEKSTNNFSPCTIGNVCTALGTSLNTTCLYTPGNRVVISQDQCGNGILEPGEECDPGQTDSNCCDRETCRLRQGAVCDPGTSSCCTSSCQFAPTSQLCRPAVNDQCDIAEYCTGNAGECPADQTRDDGTSCGSNGLQCASGYCTSKDEQCRTLGASIGVTQACPQSSSSCEVTCQNPSSSLSCVILEGQSWVAGTSCGYGGRCQDGNCVQGSWQNTVSSWYRDNLRISIPVTVVGGIVVLLILFGIIRCCVRSCGGGGKRGKAPPSASYYGAPPVPQQQHYGQQQYQQPMVQQPQQAYQSYGGNGYR